MKIRALKLHSLILAAVAASSLGSTSLRAAVGFSLSQSTEPNDFTGTVSLTVTGLSLGQEVLVEKFADVNANGTIDASDPLVRSFVIVDGLVTSFGGHRNINIPGDDDGATDGQIRVDLDQPGLDDVFGRTSGTFIYRVSAATGTTFTPITQTFTVTQHTYSQGISGHIKRQSDDTAVAGAIVVLLSSPQGIAIGGTFTNATGDYTVQTPPGDYLVLPISPGLVTDQSVAAATVVASAFTTNNQSLAAGAFTISGRLLDTVSGNGIPGVFVNASSDNNQIVGGFTDATGHYTVPALVGNWQFEIVENELAQLGYLKVQDKTTVPIVSANATNINFNLPKATALIYGTVKDNLANPVAGVDLNAGDQANTYEGVGVSAASTGNYAIGVLAGTWNQNVSNDTLPAGYIGGQGSSNLVITAGQAVQSDVVLQHVTAHLQGTVTNLGVPVTGAQVDAYQNGSGGNISTMTDGSGNFDLGVAAGTWNVVLDPGSAVSNNVVSPNLVYPIVDSQTITGIALHVISATGTISGTVKDLAGNPIGNASVNGTITISGVTYAANANTDGSGAYSFPVVNGMWTVNAYSNNLTFNPKFPNVTTSAVVNFIPTVITVQPQPQTVPTLSPATFSIQTNAPGSPTFQWQVSTNGGSVWSNLANTAPYSGVTTTTLGISSVTNAMTTYRYRCVVTYTGTPGIENSFGGVLTVNPVAPNFTQQPTPQTVPAGQSATFTAQVNDGAATFQWQISTNGGSTWVNLSNNATYGGTTTGTLTITNPTSLLNGDQYRMVATDVLATNSSGVTLTVHSAAADFNGDGNSDLVWQNTATGERYIWLMSGTAFSSAVNLGTVSTDWTIAATGDLNGDGQTDLIWENSTTGDRIVWLMNGSTYTGSVSLGTISTDWSIAGTGDFNGDGKADLVWENKVTGERVIWLMNGTTFASAVSLGTVSTDLEIAGIADFNGDGKPDLLWQSKTTGAVSFWLMNGTAFSSSGTLTPVLDPLPFNQIAGVGDFNGDGKTDIVFENTITGARSIMFLNGTTFLSTVSLTTLPTAWILERPIHYRAPIDFNGDGQSDLLWQNTSTGDRLVWLMNGTAYASTALLGNIPPAWSIAGTGDFNGDGQLDILWQNTSTGERLIWLMNGSSYSSTVSLGVVSTAWSIAGTGDFNHDGSTDILWQNTATGDRVLWLMSGTAYSSTVALGNVATAWSIAGTGDFNLDGSTDIIWQNSSTGSRVIWLMNGTSYAGTASLGVVSTAWSIAGTGDFNSDGNLDIVWQNTTTGDRFLWLMNGTTFISGVSLGNAPTAWSIRN
jgi:hypothetical protein